MGRLETLVLAVCLGIASAQDIRLNNGGVIGGSEGRVEVLYNGRWGTVCSGDYWNQEAGNVVCRQLGFMTAARVTPSSGEEYGFGSYDQDIWLDNVECYGTEATLDECYHGSVGWKSAGCSHETDAGVVCSPLRLAKSNGVVSDTREGAVQIFMKGAWKSVCATRWDTADAQVVCSELFYNSFGAVAGSSAPSATSPLAPGIDMVQCTGYEVALSKCRSIDVTYELNCYSGQVATVTCAEDKKSVSLEKEELISRAAALLLKLMSEQ